MIKDKFLNNHVVHSVDVKNGRVVAEWSWRRGGSIQDGTTAPLGYIGKRESDLEGFQKRPDQSNHPGK